MRDERFSTPKEIGRNFKTKEPAAAHFQSG